MRRQRPKSNKQAILEIILTIAITVFLVFLMRELDKIKYE